MQKNKTVLRSVSVGLIAFIIWAWLFKIDQTTRVQGSVIASSHSQNIQTMEGGVLERLLVREGSQVQKGELLAVVGETKVEAAYKEVEARSLALKAQIARLLSEVLGVALIFPDDVKNTPELVSTEKLLFEKRQTAIHQELSSLKQSLKLAQEELDMNEPLLQSGDVSKSDVIRLKRQVVDIQTQISTKQNKYFQDAQSDLAKAQEDLDSLSQNLAQKRDALEHTKIKASMAGIVKNIRFTTIGAVLKPTDELLQIVPAGDDLLIEVKIRPQDIGHVKHGDNAIIKIDAYDYTIYGTLKGELVYISPDTIDENLKPNEQPYYKARIKTVGHNLNGQNGQIISIQPGMTTTVEIITGRNTVLKYLLKPLIKTLDESMNER